MYLRRLKDLREDKDEKQQTIANLLGITRQQYSLYETRKKRNSFSLLDNSSKVLPYFNRLYPRTNRLF